MEPAGGRPRTMRRAAFSHAAAGHAGGADAVACHSSPAVVMLHGGAASGYGSSASGSLSHAALDLHKATCHGLCSGRAALIRSAATPASRLAASGVRAADRRQGRPTDRLPRPASVERMPDPTPLLDRLTTFEQSGRRCCRRCAQRSRSPRPRRRRDRASTGRAAAPPLRDGVRAGGTYTFDHLPTTAAPTTAEAAARPARRPKRLIYERLLLPATPGCGGHGRPLDDDEMTLEECGLCTARGSTWRRRSGRGTSCWRAAAARARRLHGAARGRLASTTPIARELKDASRRCARANTFGSPATAA